MGLGLLGRGIGEAVFLAECGAELLITDLKTKEQLAPSLKKLAKFKNITYVLGEHRLEDFRNCDMIIRAGNVPLDSIYLAEARANNIPIEMGESLFLKLAPGVISVGVTGTRGKTTVTYLIHEILVAAKKRVFLAGNIQGTATLPLLKKAKVGDIVVMELDSWRLQGFGDSQLSPHVSVFTNFMLDHQNYYKGDMARYFEDKSNIFRFQKEGDILITTKALKSSDEFKKYSHEGKIISAARSLPREWKTLLQGSHNLENAALALEAVRALGIPDTVSKKVIARFKGVPGRLETVRSLRGVIYVNDTTATSTDAVLAALETFKTYKKKIVLIGGGADKALDYTRYGEVIPKYIKALVLFEGAATERIIAALPEKKSFSIAIVGSMKEALDVAQQSVQKGDLVLLSPGAASFGIFKNEYDRGDQFVKLVKKLS